MSKPTKEDEKAMNAQLEELARRDATREARAKRTPSEEGVVRGKACYVMKAPHYRLGELIPAGTVVQVEDERPSKTWRRVPMTRGAKVLPPIPPRGEEAVEAFTEESPETVPVVVGEEKPNPGGIAPSLTNPAATVITSRANSPEEVREATDPRNREGHERKADAKASAADVKDLKKKHET